ncbi:aldose epimerase family protein (plasmid) [Deinococcus radiomollis]|uniref:aldose epimerase family protein n=1 Tax=Deinococcus radiomollis TaxID=468916 RepID=UPI0038916422
MPTDHQEESAVQTELWGHLPDGRPVQLFTLHSAAGVSVQLTEYGARLVRVQAPDRAGVPGDVTLGHDALAPYLILDQAPYFGAAIGRYGNRIARGRFTLDGATYQLAINNPPNHLHGGPGGFDAVLWSGTPFEENGRRGVEFRYLSPDGEEGYPGALDVTVRYTLADTGTLAFEVQATATRPTPVNVTNHAYWNLADGGAGSVRPQHLEVAADRYLPIDETSIPLGEKREVAGTPFDFRVAKPIGQDLNAPDPQFLHTGGYDHHFVLTEGGSELPGELRWAATLSDPVSGRRMQLWTTEPGVQVYSGNFLDGQIVGRGGARYQQGSAVCLEPQHAPDSPNQPAFPSVILRPGEVYRTHSEWRFSAL